MVSELLEGVLDELLLEGVVDELLLDEEGVVLELLVS